MLLAELRVLDLCDGDADAVTRLFADLGADVLKVEPPGGSAARAGLPSVAGASVAFALNNANKRSAVLDPADAADRDRLIDLAAAADIVVDSGNPGRTAAFGTSCAELSQRFAHLVAMSVTRVLTLVIAVSAMAMSGSAREIAVLTPFASSNAVSTTQLRASSATMISTMLIATPTPPAT